MNKDKLVSRFVIITFILLYALVSIISTIHVVDFFEQVWAPFTSSHLWQDPTLFLRSDNDQVLFDNHLPLKAGFITNYKRPITFHL